MSLETIDKPDTRSASGGSNDLTGPPPPESYFPDGDDDDYFSIRDGLDKLEEHANAEPARSITDGWEERARDVQPGRGYAIEELDKRHVLPSKIGGQAVAQLFNLHERRTGFDKRINTGVGAYALKANYRF